VLEGETLAGIAKQLRVSPVTLALANQLTASSSLEQGAHLVVPMAAGNDSSLARVRESVPHRLSQYRVRPGDTVDLIADRFNVTTYQIRRWNGLKSSKLTPGRTLRLYVEGRATTAHSRPAAKSKNPPRRPTTAQKKPAAPRPPPTAAAALTTH
jgi:membrane-bound lytic murein transglycosylase D